MPGRRRHLDLHHNVYVIELDKKVLEIRRFREANPNCDPELACFYVGRTGLTPEERFRQHLEGIRPNRYARKYGRWLRRRLYQKYNPMTFEDADKKEKELAEQLRAKGHAVWQH